MEKKTAGEITVTSSEALLGPLGQRVLVHVCVLHAAGNRPAMVENLFNVPLGWVRSIWLGLWSSSYAVIWLKTEMVKLLC